MSEIAGPVKELLITVEPPRQPSGISALPAVKEISAIHRQVVMAAEAGFTNAEIARMVNLDEGYVSQIRNWDHPVLEAARREARDRIAQATIDVGARIKLYAGEALDTMVRHMRGADTNSSRLAAKDLMDRAGYAPVKKVAEVSTSVPSEEFIAAVERMEKSDQVLRMRDQHAFRLPEGQKVADVPPPERTGTNG